MFDIFKTASAVFGKTTNLLFKVTVTSVVRTNGMKTSVANQIEDLRDTVTGSDLVKHQKRLRTEVTRSEKKKQEKKAAKAKAKEAVEDAVEEASDKVDDAKDQADDADKKSTKKSKKAA